MGIYMGETLKQESLCFKKKKGISLSFLTHRPAILFLNKKLIKEWWKVISETHLISFYKVLQLKNYKKMMCTYMTHLNTQIRISSLWML